MSNDNKLPEGLEKPGDNPNKLNAQPRQNVRPKKKNSPQSSNQSMKLGWIDPLPQVDVIYPLGLEQNVASIPAGEVELDFALPETIATPFADTVNSVGDKIQLVGDEQEEVKDAVVAMSYFKAARQLYSTMLDHEKAVNQSLKAVFYDETPIPAHMGGALGIIGHMKTKVGDVLVKDASVLFKRWVAAGLERAYRSDGNSSPYRRRTPENLVWSEPSSLTMMHRMAREMIATLVTQRYTIAGADGTDYVVSMPQLVDQDLDTYYSSVSDSVPSAGILRSLIAGLQCNLREFRDDEFPHDESRASFLRALGLELADGAYDISSLREGFEMYTAKYITDYKWRVETIFKTGPPPAGTSGYGAQTVQSSGNVANWSFPLSDADVNIGYLFSPSRDFKLYPRMIGYSKRRKEDGSAAFAHADAKRFYAD